MTQTFYYGASYSPLVFREDQWSQDLEKMQAAGMNLIRLGDVHGSWDLIEPSPGETRLEDLGRFYRLAAEHGLSILISTGASSPPLWLAKQHPDLQLVNNRGDCYPLGASYHWACISHHGYRQALTAYIHKLIDFTKQHPNHFGWQITNEIGFPFLPARGEDYLGLFCYCENCQEGFRQWVKDKYKTTQDLTDAWAWGTTYYVYRDWSDVFAPESPPSAWASVTRWLDWRLFWQAIFAEFAGWQHKLIKAEDPDHPTSVNTFNFKGFDRFGTFTGLDQWQLARAVDHVGYDLYPGSGNKLAKRPEFISMFLDHGRSVAASNGRDFWLHEIESGPIGGWVMGPDYGTSAEDIHHYCLEALGHDAKLMLYMPWREWAYQPLHWGALVDMDGNPTPRLDAAQAIGQFIRGHEEQLLAARVPPAEAAVVESKPNAIFFRGVDQEEELFLAQRGAYRAVWDAGFSVDFITSSLVSGGMASKYRQLILPMMGLIDKATAEALRLYTADGGLLIGFARCATLDEKGWFHHQLPVPPLQQVFGLQKIEPDLLKEHTITYQGNTYSGYWNRDLIVPGENTRVLAAFDDGWPAVTLHAHGLGYGLYLATQADAGYLQTSPSLLKDVLQQVWAELGINPRLQVLEPDLDLRSIDVHLLDADKSSFLLISDRLARSESVKMVLRDERKALSVSLVYPAGSAAINWQQQKDSLLISYDRDGKEVKIIQITWI